MLDFFNMNNRRLVRPVLITLACLALPTSSTTAALPIDLEVAAMADAPFGAMQEWAPILGQMNLANFRLRGFHDGDEPSLTVDPAATSKRYRLFGVLDRQNRLVLPGAAFGQQDTAKLKTFLEELPVREEEKHIERGPFGLTRPQFDQIFRELAATVDHTTVGVGPRSLLDELSANSKIAVEFDPGVEQLVAAAKPLGVEMHGLSLGTVLAAALRKADLQLAPEGLRGQPLVYRVSRFDAQRESWPVGWRPSRIGSQVAPAMAKFTMIEIEGFALSAALDALAPHAGVPLIRDERIIDRLRSDPFERKVKIPQGKRSIRSAIDSVLSQATLAGELRVDEGGHPFYWITQWGPESQRAR